MQLFKSVEESQFKADFVILEGYIKFSGELLRLSLLAMGGFGTLFLIRVKGEIGQELLDKPVLFLVSMIFFALCSGACLFHRYYASDSMSWYISWLRAVNEGNSKKADYEHQGLKKLFRQSGYALIVSQFLFGGGVLLFMIALGDLMMKMM